MEVSGLKLDAGRAPWDAWMSQLRVRADRLFTTAVG